MYVAYANDVWLTKVYGQPTLFGKRNGHPHSRSGTQRATVAYSTLRHSIKRSKPYRIYEMLNALDKVGIYTAIFE